MRITVFGAAGSVGAQVVNEALARGHEVRAVVRSEARFRDLPDAAEPRVGDASSVEDVAALSADSDVLVSATRPAQGREEELARTAEALLEGARRASTRLVLVGGAATLTVPGNEGARVLDDPRFVPPAWQPIAQACADQLDACLADPDADWTYLSPPASLEPGPRTGSYRLGRDELVVDAAGESRISVADLAVALVDEVENARHRRARFTAAY